MVLGRVLTLLGLTESTCLVCGGELDDPEQGYLCTACLEDIKPSHPMDYEDLSFTERYRIFGRYEGVLSETLKLIKFRSVKPLAHRLGEVVSENLLEFIGETEPDLITYVPVHRWRFWKRGFDHNEEILKGARVQPEQILYRRKHSKPLASYGREDRFRAVKDAFGVRDAYLEKIEGRRVLVFDDVLTSGATASLLN